MTSIGAEGMGVEPGAHAVLADLAGDFAAGVVRLLQDDAHWRQISDAARAHGDRLFGAERTRQSLADLVTAVSESADDLPGAHQPRGISG